jgi:hypothetical protein
VYNLAGKKYFWAPGPSGFIMMHERATFPWNDGTPDEGVAQWHYSAYPGRLFNPSNLKKDQDRLVAPITFVDGHCQTRDFTKTFEANPRARAGDRLYLVQTALNERAFDKAIVSRITLSNDRHGPKAF